MTDYLKRLALVALLALFLGGCSKNGGSMDITGEDTGEAEETVSDQDKDAGKKAEQ